MKGLIKAINHENGVVGTMESREKWNSPHANNLRHHLFFIDKY